MRARGAPGVVPLLFPPLLLKEELTVHCNAAGEGHAGLCHPPAGLNCYRATARRLQSDGCFSCHFGGIRTGSRHARPSGVIEFDSAVTVGGEQDWPFAGRYGHCASSEVMLNLPLRCEIDGQRGTVHGRVGRLDLGSKDYRGRYGREANRRGPMPPEVETDLWIRPCRPQVRKISTGYADPQAVTLRHLIGRGPQGYVKLGNCPFG